MWKLLRNLLLVAILLAGVLKLVLWYEVQQSAARLVAAWAPYAQIQYDSVGISLAGTVNIANVTATFGKGRPRAVWRAAQADLETPGPFWLLRRTLLGDESFPPHLGLAIKGLQAPAGASPFDWPWLNPISLVPFETFGCGVVSRFSVADYQRMGLNPGIPQQHLEYRYDAATGTLTFTSEMSTPPFSVISLSGELPRFDPRLLTPSGWQNLHATVLTAEYADSGYLAKRNRFCAQQAGIDAATFVDQHIGAIRTFLDGSGIQTTAAVEEIYRSLAMTGGRLSVQGLPNANFTLEALSSRSADVLVRQLNLTTRHNDAPPVMLRLAFKTTPGTEDTAIASTPATAGTTVGAATPPPLVPSSPATAPVSGPTSAVTATSAAATPAKSLPPSKPMPVNPSAVAAASRVPPVAAPAPPPTRPRNEAPAPAATSGKAPDATTALPSTPAPPEGSTLALVWKSTVDRLPETPPPARTYDVIDFAAVTAHVGRLVRVLTAGGKRVEGHIVSADPTSLTLRINKPGGNAQLQVQREVIVEIQLLRAPIAAG